MANSEASSHQFFFRCPLCDRRFVDDKARRRHLVDSYKCNAVEEIFGLQFLLGEVPLKRRDDPRASSEGVGSPGVLRPNDTRPAERAIR
jgi:hypothetical protein